MNLSLTIVGAGEFKSLVDGVESTYFLRLLDGYGNTADLDVTEEQLGQVLGFAAAVKEDLVEPEPLPTTEAARPAARVTRPSSRLPPTKDEDGDELAEPIQLHGPRRPVVSPFAGKGDDL